MFGAIQAGNVFAFVPDVSSASGAASDIINLLDFMPEIDSESTEGKVHKNVEGHIRVEKVYFRYPTRPSVRVLRDLTLEVKPGTYTALVGASGCGKSTVYVYHNTSLPGVTHLWDRIQLIERFYDPQAGTVYLDGQPISDMNIQEYRKHIALVSQEPVSQ
jgi:ATP-binding cassette, subfamily B (MDR/TAP), member 1